MKKRVLSLLLAMTLVMSLLPTSVFAETVVPYDEPEQAPEALAEPEAEPAPDAAPMGIGADGVRTKLDVSKGGIALKEGSASGYDTSGNKVTAYDPDGFIITGTSTQDGKQLHIGGGTHDVVFENLTIDVAATDYAPAVTFEGGAQVFLTLKGTNVLKSGEECPGLSIPDGTASVTITAASDGTLNAVGGKYAAGIGGRYKSYCGAITIEGGSISATAGSSSASHIGLGSSGKGEAIVTIKGGKFASGDENAETIYGKPVAEGYEVEKISGAYPYQVVRIGYPVSFDANGGTGTMDTIPRVLGTFAIPECTFTAPAFHLFEGWSLTRDGEIIAQPTIEITGPTTLYAIWQEQVADGVQSVLDVSYGKITLGKGTVSGYGEDGMPFIWPDPDGYILTGTSTDSAKTVELTGGEQNLTLRNLNIDVSATDYACAFGLLKDYKDNVTIILEEGTESTLKSGKNCAGLSKAQEYSATGTGTLTIGGTGTLNAFGGAYAAGIGGGESYKFGYNTENITITGGTINATGKSGGAGIGGSFSASYGRHINIYSGTVNAQGGDFAAGIGGGRNGEGAYITITGGTVNATGGKDTNTSLNSNDGGGAGIGGGSGGNGHDITITGGNIRAKGGEYAAGIGGGHCGASAGQTRAPAGHGYNITITGGDVYAEGGTRGAGIGGGGSCIPYNPEYWTSSRWCSCGEGYDITISGGNVQAYSWNYGAGIGGGEGGDGYNITINGGNVYAYSGSYGAAIGGGGGYFGRSSGGDGYNININNASVYAEGGAAGIGGGGNNLNGVSSYPYYSGNAWDITITDAVVTAKGDYYSGGIGSMWDYTSTKNIRITGGSVLATGKEAQAIGNEKTYVTPKNLAGQNVYLLTIANPNNEEVYIDGAKWSAKQHRDGDTNVYAYVTGASHTVKVGFKLTTYTYKNGTFSVQSETAAPGGTTVSFNANGGSGTMNKVYLGIGQSFTLPDCGFSPASGYYFLGWATSKSGTVITTESITVTSPTTLYAIWGKYAAISFNANGGSGSMSTVYIMPGETYELPVCTFTAPKGKEFKGWSTSATGEPVLSTFIQAYGDMTFYALWKDVVPDGVQKILDVSKGTVTIGADTLSAYSPEGVHLTTPDPDGYIITGTSPKNDQSVTITGGSHKLTLRDLTIKVPSYTWGHAFFANGDTQLEVTLEGTTTLQGGAGRTGFNLEGNASVIFTAESTGVLIATGDSNGIATISGDITIHGGKFDAKNIVTGSGTVTIDGGSFKSGNVAENKIYGHTVARGRRVANLGGDFPYQVVYDCIVSIKEVSGGDVSVGVNTNRALPVILARYDAQGRMTAVQILTAPGPCTLYFEMGGSGSTYRAFLVDGDFVPQCPAAVYGE